MNCIIKTFVDISRFALRSKILLYSEYSLTICFLSLTTHDNDVWEAVHLEEVERGYLHLTREFRIELVRLTNYS